MMFGQFFYYYNLVFQTHRQISDLCGQTLIDVMAGIKADPFGPLAGIYNIKIHLHQLQVNSGLDLLWSSNMQEPRPQSPPEYRIKYEEPSRTHLTQAISIQNSLPIHNTRVKQDNRDRLSHLLPKPVSKLGQSSIAYQSSVKTMTDPRIRPNFTKKPVFKVLDNGDGLDSRLPIIDEHSNTEMDSKRMLINNIKDEALRLNTEPKVDARRSKFYRRGGDAVPR